MKRMKRVISMLLAVVMSLLPARFLPLQQQRILRKREKSRLQVTMTTYIHYFLMGLYLSVVILAHQRVNKKDFIWKFHHQ